MAKKIEKVNKFDILRKQITEQIDNEKYYLENNKEDMDGYDITSVEHTIQAYKRVIQMIDKLEKDA